MANLQYLLITITVIAAAISVEDSDEASYAVDVIVSKLLARNAEGKRAS